jgi:hypothetical protein
MNAPRQFKEEQMNASDEGPEREDAIVGAHAEIRWTGSFPSGVSFTAGEPGTVVSARLIDDMLYVVIRTPDGRDFRTTHPDTYRLT